MTDQPTPTPDSGVEVRATDSTRITPLVPAQIANSSGVLATAKASHGGRLARDVRENDIVTVLGVEVSVAQAELMGLLVLGPDGRYTDADPEAAKAALETATKAPAPEAADPALEVPFTEEGHAAVAALAAGLESAGLNPVGLIGAYINSEGQLPRELVDVARAQGIEEADVLHQISEAVGHIEVAINSYLVNQAGVSAEQLDDFWTYAAEVVYRPELTTAIAEAVFLNSGAPFKKIARQFAVKNGRGLGSLADKESLSEETVRGPHGPRKVHTVRGTFSDGKPFKAGTEGLRRAGLA